jgi:gas vesicle protein
MIAPMVVDNSNLWAPVLSALLAGGLVALINGLLLRPKTTAEARQTNVTAEVSLSADSRQWVDQAMARATRAERRLDAVEEENDQLRRSVNELLDYIRVLHRDWGSTTPPPPPPNINLGSPRGAAARPVPDP